MGSSAQRSTTDSGAGSSPRSLRWAEGVVTWRGERFIRILCLFPFSERSFQLSGFGQWVEVIAIYWEREAWRRNRLGAAIKTSTETCQWDVREARSQPCWCRRLAAEEGSGSGWDGAESCLREPDLPCTAGPPIACWPPLLSPPSSPAGAALQTGPPRSRCRGIRSFLPSHLPKSIVTFSVLASVAT